jgi:hypothetical protein
LIDGSDDADDGDRSSLDDDCLIIFVSTIFCRDYDNDDNSNSVMMIKYDDGYDDDDGYDNDDDEITLKLVYALKFIC